jgi:proteic killer suppression protein
MIRSFANQGTEDVFDGEDTKAARKACPPNLWRVARRRMLVLDAARDLRDLKSPGAQLERLLNDRKGQWGVRVNDQYRVCFRWEQGDAHGVEIADYH